MPPFIVRVALLYIGAFCAILISFAIQALKRWEAFSDVFGAYCSVFPIFSFPFVATMICMALPEAIVGADCYDEDANPDSTDHTEKFTVFGLTSFLILPLVPVFLPSVQTVQTSRNLWAISREGLLWPFFFVWWTHGVINAIGVAKARLRHREVLAARKRREERIRERFGA